MVRTASVIGVVLLAGCTGSTSSNALVGARDCSYSSCDFSGVDDVKEMMRAGEDQTGDWNGWDQEVRGAMRRSDVDGMMPCSGTSITATTRAADLRAGDTSEPGLHLTLTLARWSDGEISCMGETTLVVNRVPTAVLGTALPGLGAFVEIKPPDVNSSLVL
jgi:hypothetical protein